ncbi:MAG: hypothetical protein M3R25_09775 [Bacteroidota bacterium]|nr:hypothetical protein [Bacteroidota bacterium]
MKNLICNSKAIFTIVCATILFSCQKEELVLPELTGKENHFQYDVSNDNPRPGPVSPLLYDKTISQWTQDWWKHVMSIDCYENPLVHSILKTVITQEGPVVFLMGTDNGSALRFANIRRDQSVLIPIFNTLKKYPCDEQVTVIGSEQSLEQFLKREAKQYINQVTNIKVSLDDAPITISNENRVATELFHISGNATLVNCLDACASEKNKPAVSDGYWLVIPRLEPGRHVIRVHAEILQNGTVVDVLYNIAVN